MVPDRESEHAYVRRAAGVTYICPWQTRLRCQLSYRRMLSAPGSAPGPAARLHILASVWTVPLAWFAPFAGTERWLALGPGGERPGAAHTALMAQALLYTTPMPRARRRVARGRWLARFHHEMAN